MNTKEESALHMPKDQEALKIILENAEVDFEEVSDNGITGSFELENGIKFNFSDSGELLGIEV